MARLQVFVVNVRSLFYVGIGHKYFSAEKSRDPASARRPAALERAAFKPTTQGLKGNCSTAPKPKGPLWG